MEQNPNPQPTTTEHNLSNVSDVDVSDAESHIDLNADTYESSDDIEEISPPPRAAGRDKTKCVAKHVEEADRKARHMVEIEAKFQEHKLLQKEKNDLQREYLDFFRRQL